MNKLIVGFLSIFLLVSCNQMSKTNAQNESQSSERAIILDTLGNEIVVEKSSKVNSDKPLKQTCKFGDLTINLEEKNQKLFVSSNCKVVEDFTIDLDAKLEAIIETDVNSDGFDEFYCVTKSGNLIAYASYKDKSFGEIYVPQKPLYFYNDFNELTLWEVKKDHLILTFSNGVNNQINVVRYTLKAGENGFILEAK